MDATKKESLKIQVAVSGKNYSKGRAISGYEANALITKESDGRTNQNDTDTLIIRASDCGTPEITAEYNSKAIGQGEIKTNVEIDLKGKALDLTKNELLDSMSENAKLSKTDAGRSLDKALEDKLNLTAKKSCESNCASGEARYETKITENVK